MTSDDRLERIESHLAEMNTTLAKQSVVLEEHVRRTSLLEQRFSPVEKHVSMVDGIVKFLGLLAIIATILMLFKK